MSTSVYLISFDDVRNKVVTKDDDFTTYSVTRFGPKICDKAYIICSIVDSYSALFRHQWQSNPVANGCDLTDHVIINLNASNFTANYKMEVTACGGFNVHFIKKQPWILKLNVLVMNSFLKMLD